jgi:hypothetical protein
VTDSEVGNALSLKQPKGQGIFPAPFYEPHMEGNNMRRLMILVMTMILVGCAAIQPYQATTQQPTNDRLELSALSLASQIELYVIENDILAQLEAWNIPVPHIVFEVTAEDRRQIQCLARNIYWEAGGEPIRGKAAVAQVTVNRTVDDRFADDICGVVYERDRVKVRGRMRTICQFSWTCMTVKNKEPKSNEQWDDALAIAQKFVLDGVNLPELNEALFYHAQYVHPRWAKQMVRIERIGNHIFYREKVRQTGIYLASNN